jgi:hypothetical protein
VSYLRFEVGHVHSAVIDYSHVYLSSFSCHIGILVHPAFALDRPSRNAAQCSNFSSLEMVFGLMEEVREALVVESYLDGSI